MRWRRDHLECKRGVSYYTLVSHVGSDDLWDCQWLNLHCHFKLGCDGLTVGELSTHRTYRLSQNVKPLIWVECIVDKHSRSRTEYLVKARSQVPLFEAVFIAGKYGACRTPIPTSNTSRCAMLIKRLV